MTNITKSQLPALQPGDHLTRAEFERRYAAMPHLKKAELIEGVVHMPSPVRLPAHGAPHAKLIGFCFHYQTFTPGVEIGDNVTVRLDWHNEPQPDVVLLITPEHKGKATLSAEGYIEGAPELVGEVSAGTVSFDLHTKKAVYQRNGVQEYVVWRVLDEAVDWFVLREGVYQPLLLDADGCYRSLVFPGLWLHASALLSGDLQKVLAILQTGLASSEHAAFVAELQRRRQP